MFVVEVFNKGFNADGDFFIADEVSKLFVSKTDADNFVATASQTEKFLTAIAGTCGCLENGDDVSLMMGIANDSVYAYCADCA